MLPKETAQHLRDAGHFRAVVELHLQQGRQIRKRIRQGAYLTVADEELLELLQLSYLFR